MSPNKSIEYYPAAVATLAMHGIQQCLQFFGVTPESVILPYSVQQVKVLCRTIDDWAILQCSYDGNIDNHYP